MARFVVRHQHEPDRCPAADPYTGAKLLNYLSRPRVRQHGIEIHGEAIVRGEHTLYIIVGSEDEDRVRRFMQPSEIAGSVDQRGKRGLSVERVRSVNGEPRLDGTLTLFRGVVRHNEVVVDRHRRWRNRRWPSLLRKLPPDSGVVMPKSALLCSRPFSDPQARSVHLAA